MKLTQLFNGTCTQPNATSYWPSCTQHPKTLSFRSISCDEVFLGTSRDISYQNDSKEQPPKYSIACAEDLLEDEEGVERVIRGLKSERLFFEPEETNSILRKAKKASKGSSGVNKTVTLLSMESLDPYLDFKKSVEEMVEAHGVSSWDWLQELLGCYLKVNEKSNHKFIIEAFVDLLVTLDLEDLGLITCSSSVASTSSPVIFSSSNMGTSFGSSLNLLSDDVTCSS